MYTLFYAKAISIEAIKLPVPCNKILAEIPEQETFAVVGATIADNFGVKMPEGTIGSSLLSLLK